MSGHTKEAREVSDLPSGHESSKHLIAAAAFMLEALELMVSTYEEGGWPDAAVTIARAAILKAKGIL